MENENINIESKTTEEAQQPIKQFSDKIEPKVIKALSSFKSYASEPISWAEASKKEHLFFMDNANICLLEAKTEEAKRVLCKFVEASQSYSYPTAIKQDYQDKKMLFGGKYSTHYLLNALKLFNIWAETSTEIRTAKDFPSILENEHYVFILAPRVENN